MSSALNIIAFLTGFPGWAELLVVAMIGLLIFGKRLPEVGKSLGKSIVEFKKGLRGIEDDIEKSIDQNQADMLPPPDTKSETDTAGRTEQTGETSQNKESNEETVPQD